MKRFFSITSGFLFSCYFLLNSPLLQAQQAILSITGISVPDTVYEGTPYSNITVTIKNSSVFNPFNGALFVLIQEDTLGPVVTDTLINSAGIAILPGDSTVISTNNYVFTSSVYKAGGNTVVVWPSANQTVTIDSIVDYFVFVPFNSIAWHGNSRPLLNLWPNPAGNHIVLEGKMTPAQVRIYNLEGKLLYNQPYKGRRINLTGLPPGVYCLEALYNNGSKSVKKFIRQ